MPRLCLILALWLAAAPTHAAAAGQVLAGRTMGTTWRVTLVAPPGLDAARLQHGIQAELDRVDGQMSTWRADSDLMRFNRAPAGSCQVLAPEFHAVLARALALARDTGGAYDPTVGPLVNLWGFGPERRPRERPAAADIAAARARVGWRRLRLEAGTRRVCQPGGVALDLSAVAKGFGVDQVARRLQREGIGAWLVEVGGELRAQGRKADGSRWRVGIERPDAAPGAASSATDLVRAITLEDRAIATSGDYRHAFEDHGVRYSHHIDPLTGYPVPFEIASVSVLAPTALEADPIGTAISVMGAERGLAWARARGLAVLVVVRHGEGFEQRLSPAFVEEMKR